MMRTGETRVAPARRSAIAGQRAPAPRVDYGAHAHGPVVERDVPEPAVGEGGGVNVVGELAGEAFRAPEVAEDGQVLEEVVELAEGARSADHGRLAARVDHEAGREAEGRAAGAPRMHDRPPVVGLDLRHRVLLAHLRAVGARVLEQELVELGAHHLIGVRPPARVLAEPEAPWRALAAPEEGAAR